MPSFFLIHSYSKVQRTMSYRIKKVAVLGSGVMGTGIACHMANVGMEVLMLDILPPQHQNPQGAQRNQVAV